MKRLLLILSIMLYLLIGLFSGLAFPQEAITGKAAEDALRALLPDVKLISVNPSPIGGLYEVAIESGGKKGIVYLDAGGKYAIFGALVDIASKTNLTQARFDEINIIEFSSIPLNDSIVLGDKNAKHKVVVFDDPD